MFVFLAKCAPLIISVYIFPCRSSLPKDSGNPPAVHRYSGRLITYLVLLFSPKRIFVIHVVNQRLYFLGLYVIVMTYSIIHLPCGARNIFIYYGSNCVLNFVDSSTIVVHVVRFPMHIILLYHIVYLSLFHYNYTDRGFLVYTYSVCGIGCTDLAD